MTEREILEWFARRAEPTASRLLGFRMREADPATGRVLVEFAASAEFCNPIGTVQGGFIAAMLDDAMSVAALVKSQMRLVVPTLEMKISFLAPVRPGPVLAEGRVLQLGKSSGFLEGRLNDMAGTLLATASATVRPVPAPWVVSG